MNEIPRLPVDSTGIVRNHVHPYTHRYNIGTPTDQHLSNTNRWNNTNTYHGHQQSSNPALVAGVGTAYPWYHGARETSEGQNGGWYMYNQSSADTNNYYRNHAGPSHQTIYDVNNTNGRCNGSYQPLTSKGTSCYANGTWANGPDSWRNETAVQGYYSNTAWTDITAEQRGGQTAQGYDTSHSDRSQCNVQLNGLGQWISQKQYDACFQLQHQSFQSQNRNTASQTKGTPDGASRKRKMTDETEATPTNNEVTSAPKVDKRALYSKFRVVKKTEISPSCNESSKVTPTLWRAKLDDKTIVDVNRKDGLPNNAKLAKVVPTLTPVKENEAAATIGNIKFITLENMKVVRRKLELVLAMQQGEERQERLALEAKVRAKVKVNAKERARKDKKRTDRKRQVKIGL